MNKSGFLIVFFLCYLPAEYNAQDKFVLIENATMIDLGDQGKSDNDVVEACILLKNDRIHWLGNCNDLPEIPDETFIIDASGKYVMPGLIDGFAAINNQSYCNALLYLGVTSVIAVDGGRRGVFFSEGNPAPMTYRLEGVGDEKISTDSLLFRMDNYYRQGYKIMLLMYGLTPDQLKIAIEKAAEYDMGTIGEMGYTTYKKGLELGLDAVVHTTRYSMDIASRDMAVAVANEPFSNVLSSPKWQYYKFLTGLENGDVSLTDHAKVLGKSSTFIMPTSSLSYLDIADHKNPWNEPASAMINIEDINRPADPITGNHSIDSTEQAAYSSLIETELKVIEPTYYKYGANYLAGSGTDVWGTMPGISLHTELWILHNKIGLSIRETLAAATSNFSKAFGWKNGEIKVGYVANILILNNNPLDDLEHLKDIETVILKGEILRTKDLLPSLKD